MRPLVVPFRAEHMLAIVPREPFDDQTIDDAWRKEREGPAFTVIVNDKPIACAGVMLVRPGVGYAWTVFSHDFLNYRLYVTRSLRRALRDIVKGCALHRVEAQTLEDNYVNRKWLEHLGFEVEGIAHDYTSDRRNVVRYEWVRYKLRIVAVAGAPGTRQFIARIGDDEVGWAIHYYTLDGNNYAYGIQCEVAPEYRGRGIGLALHHARLDIARRDGAPFFVGITENPAMIRILEKCGARRTVSELGITYVVKL